MLKYWEKNISFVSLVFYRDRKITSKVIHFDSQTAIANPMSIDVRQPCAIDASNINSKKIDCFQAVKWTLSSTFHLGDNYQN